MLYAHQSFQTNSLKYVKLLKTSIDYKIKSLLHQILKKNVYYVNLRIFNTYMQYTSIIYQYITLYIP